MPAAGGEGPRRRSLDRLADAIEAGVAAEKEHAERERRESKWFKPPVVISIVSAVIAVIAASSGLVNLWLGLWNKERAVAALQWNEKIKIKVRSDGPGKITVRNDSRVEALNVEIYRRRLYYSPLCGSVFIEFGHRWDAIDRLGPYGSKALELNTPCDVTSVLALPHGTCLVENDGGRAFRVTNVSNLMQIGATIDHSVITGADLNDLGSLDVATCYLDTVDAPTGTESQVCTEAAPCRAVELIQATAVHAKTLELSGPFEYFFLVGDHGEWIRSRDLSVQMVNVNAPVDEEPQFRFRDPATAEMFTRVAEWLKHEAEHRRPIPPEQPFGGGLWRMTGVSAPDGGILVQ
jgi:hypothetical protein